MITDDFVVSGTCSEQMYGMCESLWEPDMVSGVAAVPAFSSCSSLENPRYLGGVKISVLWYFTKGLRRTKRL